MLFTLMMVLYVVLAVFLIGFILIQRGAGASAGSGFGGGASATVFGARGAASFLTKATKWLAITFFAITLFMAWYATRQATDVTAGTDLGVMSQVPAAPVAAPGALEVPTAPAPAAGVPAAPEQAAPQQQESAVPGAPAEGGQADGDAGAEDPAAQTQ